MRNAMFIASFLFGLWSFGQDTRNATTPCLTVEGTISKTSIYIQNPEDGDGNGFCADSVFVNNLPLPDSIFNSSAFEINFLDFDLCEGNQVTVRIYHKIGCKPKLLTGAGCYFPPKNGIQFTEIKVD